MNGAKRIRTADPLHAMQVLYQLSYGPISALGGPDHGDPVGLSNPGLIALKAYTAGGMTFRAGATRPQACPGQ